MAAAFLLLTDLANQIGHDRIVQYFDDDGDGIVLDADAPVVQVLEQAESMYYSRMRRAYPGRQTLIDIAVADPVVKGHVVWIACELASERRTEFAGSDGWGAYRIQYERALSELELLSKGRNRTVGGEEVAGLGANIAGNVQPKPPVGQPDQFVFAPSKARPGGTGGF